MSFLRFILGLAIGSFINVVALRYDPDRLLFANDVIGGRSYCPHCRRILRWYELVPLLSYAALRGRCRTCRARINPRYFLVEAGSALIFLFVPLRLAGTPLPPGALYLHAALWVSVFTLLFLLALIDLRTSIIPDEINGALIILALANIFLSRPLFGLAGGSFIERYALLFGIRQDIWLNHGAGALFGALFFAALIIFTRGRGMGVGDAKLALALGFLFGWPDIIFIVAFSFVIGSFVGIVKIFRKTSSLKSAVPFGQFLALASLLVFFFGNQVLGWYFSLFGIF